MKFISDHAHPLIERPHPRRLRTLSKLIAATLSLTPLSRASTLYFDTNSSTPASGVLPSATYTWDTTTPLWSTDPAGSSATQTWDPSATADFSAGADATSSFSILIRGAPAPAGITIEEGNLSFLHNGILSLDNTPINIAASSSLSILTVLAGTTFTKSGPGTLSLSNSTNTFTGGFSITGGVVQFPGENTLTGSSPSYTGMSPTSLIPNYIRLSAGTLRDTSVSSSPVILNPNKGIYLDSAGGTLDIPDTSASNPHSYAGPISGPGSLTKTGPGLLLFSPATSLSYTGPTTLSAGTLRLSASNQLPSTTALSLSSSATLDLANFNQSISSLAGSGKIINAARLTLSPTSDSTWSGALSGPGGLTIAGSSFLTLSSPQSYTGPTLLTGSSPSFGLRLAANNALPTNSELQFNPSSTTSSPTLDLNGFSQSLPSITSLNPSLGSPIITNSSNTSSTLTINSPLSFTLPASLTGSISLIKSGTGSLTLQNLSIPSLMITSGQVHLAPNLTATPHLTSFTITTGGLFDLSNNRLDLTSTPLASLTASLFSARTGTTPGDWLGSAGITSSLAAADPTHSTAIAYATASQLGVTSWGTASNLSPTDLLTQYTYYGDLNLDGRITPDDYARIDRSLAQGGLPGSATWTDGDVNYDRTVDQSDYLLLDRSFALHGGTLTPDLLAQRETRFGEPYVAYLLATLPDPTCPLAFFFVEFLLLSRQRPIQKNPCPNRTGHS